METFEYQGRKIHRWVQGPSTFLADPAAGGRLISWFTEMADGSVRDVIYWPEDADYGNIGKVRGGTPILFPFAGRCHADGAVGFWEDSDGSIRPMPQHGFARPGTFELIDANESCFKAILLPDDLAKKAYPYNYEFRVSYFFSELGFLVELGLRNNESIPIPWCPGHHFYFSLPWHPVFSFDEPVLVNRIHTHLKSAECIFGPKGGEENITIRFKNEDSISSSRSLVTWTESEVSPFYCVEPWMGPPNSPAHRNGLQFVNPGESSAFAVEVSLI